MNINYLKNYAKLIVKTGVNIQNNQILVVKSPVECAYFTRTVAEIAYKEGAREVVIDWNDEKLSRIKYINAKDDVFDEFPKWREEFYNYYVRKGAAFLSISASDPEIMKGVDVNKIVRLSKASSSALSEYRNRLMNDTNSWCVVGVPTKAWAKKVFKDCSEDEAVEKLWNAVFKTSRVDNSNAIKAWEAHNKSFIHKMDFLNKNRFKYIVYSNSLGTDLKIELPKDHLWLGGSSFNSEGIEFMANIPTEEVFTLPLKTGVNGKVVSSKPLNLNGSLIENFSLTFKDGRIVSFTAEKGYDSLKRLIETEDASHYLGEVALVPYDSPISNSNILFYSTLFDENVSCHLAIGDAYPTCLKNSKNMSRSELDKAGVNHSIEHVDFMVGTKDLNIIGIKEDGSKLDIFRDGNFTI
ncbi:MAG: aminopeptidase [Clostridium sp.]|nr:aminopeptidase [Clostridium sp.]